MSNSSPRSSASLRCRSQARTPGRRSCPARRCSSWRSSGGSASRSARGGEGEEGGDYHATWHFPKFMGFFFLLYCLEHVSQVGPVLPGAHVGEHDHHRVDLGAGPALQEAGHPDQAVVLLRRRWGGEGGEEIQRFSTFFVVDVGERDPLLRPLPQHPLNHSDPQYFTVYFDPLYTSL